MVAATATVIVTYLETWDHGSGNQIIVAIEPLNKSNKNV
jgi:hypothetical protein